jgi:hypothetical protein
MLLHIPTFGIYLYNASANRWDKVAETNPQRTLRSQMFDYDDEHNVHVMASYNYAYDQDIWVFRYKNVGPSAAEAPVKAGLSGLRLSCSPNPMRIAAEISFHLKKPSRVNLALYDIRGRLQKTLINAAWAPGGHSVALERGRMPAGCYVLRLTADRKSESRNLIIAD